MDCAEIWPFPEDPCNPYPYPYLTLLLAALIPPLWHRIWVPSLIEWDERWASPFEREQARQANMSSGVAQLMAYAAMQQAAIKSGKAPSTA